jgi:hypothetical protein
MSDKTSTRKTSQKNRKGKRIVKLNVTAKKFRKSSNPTYFNMIITAIRDLKDAHGSSRQAILKFIVNKYNVDSKLAVVRARIELKKALANGNIKHGKSKWLGLSDSFRQHTQSLSV